MANLKPFPKGVSGNPAGRKPNPPPEVAAVQRRVIANLADELKLAADLAVDRLVAIVSDPKTRDGDAVSAASQILDRSFGRPLQTVDARVQVEDQSTVLTAADIRKAALLVAAQHAEDA